MFTRVNRLNGESVLINVKDIEKIRINNIKLSDDSVKIVIDIDGKETYKLPVISIEKNDFLKDYNEHELKEILLFIISYIFSCSKNVPFLEKEVSKILSNESLYASIVGRP